MICKYFALWIFILMLAGAGTIHAQVIDHSSSFKQIAGKSYFRFQYDNDYFTKQDWYYSQGVSFEYVHPGLAKFPGARLLCKPKNSVTNYGLALNLFAYTPTTILSENILYGDRPYAAVINLKLFSIAIDSVRHRRVSAAISLGVIGPAALGDEIQTNIHQWLKNPLPRGWNTQVQNDVALNYQLNYEKAVISAPGNFLLNAVGELRIGTLDDKVATGFNFMAGNFNDRYVSAPRRTKSVEYYFYSQARAIFVAYDASLQGGVFNRHDPYDISGRDIKRAVFQADAGIVVNFKKINLSYSQSVISKEFSTGKYHRWGGVNIAFIL